MTWELTVGSILGAIAAGISGSVALYAWHNRSEWMGLPFFGLVLSLTLWPALYGIQLGFDTLPEQLIWQRLSLGLAGFVPTLCLLFVFAYTRRETWIRRPVILALLTEPIAFLLLCLSNPTHGLIWSSATRTVTPVGIVPDLVFGPGYVVHIVYAYAAVAVGLGLLAMYGMRVAPMYQKQVTLLVLGAIPAFAAHIAFTLRLSPIPALDVTPFLFAFTSVVFGLALFRFELLRLAPIARDQSLEEVGDGLVVLNERGEIVDLYGVATSVLEPPPSVGDHVDDVFPDTDIGGLDGQEVTVGLEGQRRVYLLQVSELTDHEDEPVGTTLIFRDVTGLRESEQRLSVSNRVLRHNLRNEMNVVLGHARELERELDGSDAERAAKIRNSVETFMDLAEKARTITQLDSLPEGRQTAIDPVGRLQGLIADLEDEYPAVDVSLSAPDGATIENIDPHTFDLALENVLDNAARHNESEEPWISVRVEGDEEAVTVEIADNGPGLPAVERRTLEAGMETSLEHSQGLGLWLTYWCVWLWGGQLELDSDETGTTITISIPRHDEHAMPEVADAVR